MNPVLEQTEIFKVEDLAGTDIAALAEQEAQRHLGISAEDAYAMLDRGELEGTIAASELVMLRSLANA